MGNIRSNDKVVNEILQTRDYSKFKLTVVNREINQNKVKRLAASMSKIGFINQPIKVNVAGEIIDGQHRWLAAQKVGVPVSYFIDRSGLDIFDNMVATNSIGTPWTKQNSIHGLAAKGKLDYQRLEKFQAEFPEFTLTEQLMFMNNSFTGVDKVKFERGEWKHKDLNIARKWATDLMQLKPYFKGFNKSLFVRAMIDILSKYPTFKFDVFLRKVQLRPGSIYLCGDVPSYKVMIEAIYNYKQRSEDKLNLRF